MANRPAPALMLREGDEDALARWTRSISMRAGLVVPARIVRAAAGGESNEQIARPEGTSRATVIKWRSRYQAKGLQGLVDDSRSGRPRRVGHRDIVASTLAPPPKNFGVTHWSTRLLAAHLGIGDATVARAWREYGVQPWRSETFKYSTDPQLVAKVTDVVGLYLEAPGERHRALCRRVPDPGAGPRRSSAADATEPARVTHPRLQAAWHHLVRCPGDGNREGHRRVQVPAPPTGVPRLPQAAV